MASVVFETTERGFSQLAKWAGEHTQANGRAWTRGGHGELWSRPSWPSHCSGSVGSGVQQCHPNG